MELTKAYFAEGMEQSDERMIAPAVADNSCSFAPTYV
jgi:hypothetical protein